MTINGDRAWLAWEKAATAVEAVKQDIWIDASGSAKNLPKEGASFGKKVNDICEHALNS